MATDQSTAAQPRFPGGAEGQDARAFEAQPRFLGLPETQGTRVFLLACSAAAVIAVMSAIWMWSSQPDYRVLFSNYSDRDGGAIVASLQQMNVPYKISDGGNAILVPDSHVHEARLKLASQGLPKGGNVGFELMENQKMGISQFLEQINFQRATEGELARSIETISSVQAARVHLAIPKDSVFVRDQQKPTASVILNLRSARLDPQQVSAIVHLVASSVPELSAQSVTIVDQSGNLLSDTTKQAGNNQLNPSQLKYVQEMQENIVKRIESIISPIVGPNNVRAEATADIDFNHVEQAAETYKPNQTPSTASIRSMQSSDAGGGKAGINASGIPGTLSNQPPGSATAPITTAAGASATAAAPGAPAAADTGSGPHEATVNYELDKTVRYTQQAAGGIKRLAVAVVVNYKHETDKNGKSVNRELNDAEKAQIISLAKEAMGFSQERGDSINVVNSQFVNTEKELAEDPIWKQPGTVELVKNVLKYVVGFFAIFYLFSNYLKPLITKIMERKVAPRRFDPGVVEEDGSVVRLSQREPAQEAAQHNAQSYEKNLSSAKDMAKQDPKVVANVVKNWVNNE